MCAGNFRWCRCGAEQRVKRAQTWERTCFTSYFPPRPFVCLHCVLFWCFNLCPNHLQRVLFFSLLPGAGPALPLILQLPAEPPAFARIFSYCCVLYWRKKHVAEREDHSQCSTQFPAALPGLGISGLGLDAGQHLSPGDKFKILWIYGQTRMCMYMPK